MPNILYLADIHPKSHNLKWIDYFSELPGYQVFVLPLKNQLNRSNLEYLSKSVTVLGALRPYSLWKIWNVFSDLNFIKTLTKRHKIDIIHVMYAEPNANWALWKCIIKTPFVLTTRGTDILKSINRFSESRNITGKLAFLLYKKAFKKFDKITSTSQSQITLLRNWCPEVKIIKIRTGVNIDKIKTFLDENNNRTSSKVINKNYILFPRSIYPLYNHEFSLEALKYLHQEIKDNYKFIFLGSDTKDRDYYNKLITISQKLNLAVEFLPTQNGKNYLKLLNNASVVVMNPKSDGSPVSAMEAMYLEKPLILPPLNYDSDIFDENVLRFKKWDPKILAQLISDVVTSKVPHLNKMLSISKENILREADFKKGVIKIDEIYKSLAL
ncbi:hypothetical protein C9994_06385 [Marivirga lumbricoides]|uniref:Glycosyl transferase family 1 domain-containing protein n=1 Tax=Marivirga lumbricoides TaxID=1046115 RepID=A0A2T4DS77_9BACT|nr:hypothetical protein C9994_06385 [Marivirga lumbricoides]